MHHSLDTAAEPGVKHAPAPAVAGAPAEAPAALAAGHRLQDLRIQQLLSVGRSSLVYAAWDTTAQLPVVVKEYLPPGLVRRDAQGWVWPLSANAAPACASGLQAFLDEARLLMAVRHPSLVPVLRCWRQQGTAYLVMPQVQGSTLQQWLAGLGTPPSEIWLRQMLAPLMQGLQALHHRGGQHGDVSVRSVWLQFDNRAQSYLGQPPRPLLLGFGAAGRALSQLGAAAAPVLDGGFGPIEQSDGAITARQGAWTDVYGLCAVLYTAIAGRPPLSSMARMARDDLVSARKVGRGRYSPAFLDAIDAGLAVRPHDRLQTMEALRQTLSLQPGQQPGQQPSQPAGAAGAAPAGGRLAPWQAAGTRGPGRWLAHHGLWPAAAGVLLLLLALLGTQLLG